jgi:hypothetical protein
MMQIAQEHGFSNRIVELNIEVNAAQAVRMVGKIYRALGEASN